MYKSERGFSLLELLIVLSIIVIIATMGSGFYFNYSESVKINSVAKAMAFDLKKAQAKSMAGEGNFKWGIHFSNTTTDHYEIFSTPTDYSDAGKMIISTNYLGNGVSFSDPTSGLSKDIIFSKISGGTSVSSVAITSSNNTKTITVSNIGTISTQ